MKKQSVLVAVVLVVTTGFSPLSKTVQSVERNIVMQFDMLSRSTQELFNLTMAPIRSGWRVTRRIEDIEKRNRTLYRELTTCQLDLGVKKTSTGSATPIKGNVRSGKISQFAGRWIVLMGTRDGMEQGDIAILDGTYLGTVISVSKEYATLETVFDQASPLLAIHSQTRTTGLYSVQGGKQRITFTQVIPDLRPGDVITSSPDGKHTKESYPIGTVASIETIASDSVSRALLTPLAKPRVFDDVLILRSL